MRQIGVKQFEEIGCRIDHRHHGELRVVEMEARLGGLLEHYHLRATA